MTATTENGLSDSFEVNVIPLVYRNFEFPIEIWNSKGDQCLRITDMTDFSYYTRNEGSGHTTGNYADKFEFSIVVEVFSTNASKDVRIGAQANLYDKDGFFVYSSRISAPDFYMSSGEKFRDDLIFINCPLSGAPYHIEFEF